METSHQPLKSVKTETIKNVVLHTITGAYYFTSNSNFRKSTGLPPL